MSQSLSRILLHVVFSTKRRAPLIPRVVTANLHAYLAGVCRAQGSEAFRVGGTDDHVHLACALPRTVPVSRLVQVVKESSSRWLKTQDPRCDQFAWQNGYAAFSFAQSQLGAVCGYIGRQPEHHRTASFQDELLELLRRHEVDHDERLLWD